jgi:hypothetical protein
MEAQTSNLSKDFLIAPVVFVGKQHRTYFDRNYNTREPMVTGRCRFHKHEDDLIKCH